MKKVACVITIVLGTLVSLIGIPLIINMCYQCDTVIIPTKWGAADMLSYYGTLLGAVTTVAALVVTIAFTKKQIQHDRFLDQNYTKWEGIESSVTKILMDISPLIISDFEKMDSLKVETLFAMLTHLQAYETTIKTSLDAMKCHINSQDRQQIAAFEDQLSDCIAQFREIEQKLKGGVFKLATVTAMNQGSLPPEAFLLFHNEYKETIDKIQPAHDGPYQELLSKKREVFDKIYADIEQQAEEILQFKKREKDDHAHT